MSQYARFGQRLASHVGDLIIVNLILLPTIVIVNMRDLNFNYSLIQLIVWCAYSTYFNASDERGTYGKKLMGLKVEHLDGTKLTYLESFVRFILGFAVFGFLVGIIPILFTNKKQGFHDLILSSVVRVKANQ
ncbi:RDD family protein [Algivirga pacifica]|uniref:RDD domain-containing protein n=1 Tax=Algivirga pacifica TaxID=1162670 RepID=A0ABP9D1J2_9BACT